MRHALWLLPLLVLVAPGCDDAPSADAERSEPADAQEVDVPLDQVPANVKQAALDAVPGLALSSAEKEVEDGSTVYDLEGAVDGKAYEVEVTAAGKVLDVETGADDDDEDDDEDDDDE